MKRISYLLVLTVFLYSGSAHGVGTEFTYQGQLSVSGSPADGPYDFEFRLFDTVAGGSPIGGIALSVDDLEVSEGVFTVSLDFGLSPFDGSDLWLDLRVREGASINALTELAPRQKLTAVPYAVHSEFVAAGTVGQAEINPSEVQRRVSESCNVGDAIRSIQSDGTVICEPVGSDTEPAGVTSSAFFTQTSLDSSVTNLGSQTITAPDDGVIVAIGKGTFNLSHSFAVPGPRVLFSVSRNLGFHSVSPTQVAANDDFNNLDLAATAISAFSVTAGEHEIYLMGSETTGNGNANAKDLSLILMYFPAEYGPNPF